MAEVERMARVVLLINLMIKRAMMKRAREIKRKSGLRMLIV